MTKLLEGKSAIIYGGGGAIGGGVARTFAREGAQVFLVGRTREPLDQVASEITSAGGAAQVAVLDAPSSGSVLEIQRGSGSVHRKRRARTARPGSRQLPRRWSCVLHRRLGPRGIDHFVLYQLTDGAAIADSVLEP